MKKPKGWRGDSRGHSIAAKKGKKSRVGISKETLKEINNDIRRTKEVKEKLRRGLIQPKDVVGSGYKNPRKVANDYLNNRLSYLELAKKGKIAYI